MTAGTTALDPFPSLHVRPPSGWVNDPNGLGHWDGRWHVFFQYNPHAPVHAAIHWGHMSSADLVTWREEPVALAPRPGTVDAAGAWSGVAVIDDGEPVLVYTAVPDHAGNAGVALARRDEASHAWAAGDHMVAPPPSDRGLHEVRDPFLFTVDGRRYGLMGGGRTGGTPVVVLYAVPELDRWEPLGDLLHGGHPVAAEHAPARVWECPQLVLLPDGTGAARWVLLLSLWESHHGRPARGVAALVGDLDLSGPHPVFVPTVGHRLDEGPDLYAPAVHAGADRALLWAWSWEPGDRGQAEVDAAGWAGVLTFPRELVLRGERVLSVPARELTALRGEALRAAAGVLAPPGPAWEADADGGVAVVLVGGSEGDGGSERTVWTSPPGAAHVRVLVDGSILEAFADGVPYTARVYPAPGERWRVRGHDARGRLSGWELVRPTP